jgi:hypothetical protein
VAADWQRARIQFVPLHDTIVHWSFADHRWRRQVRECVHPGVIEATWLCADYPSNPIAAREQIGDHGAVESLRPLDHDNGRPPALLQLQDQRGR